MARTSTLRGDKAGRPALKWITVATTLLACAGCGPADEDDAPMASGGTAPVRDRDRVIFVLLDAARSDRFSCYGHDRETTPVMDAIAAEGVRFANHFTNAPNTRASLPNILLSRYFAPSLFHSSRQVPLESPDELFRVFDERCTSLPKAFSAAGYATAAISAHSWTRPGTQFAKQFDELFDLPDLVEYDEARGFPTGDHVVDAAIDWMDGRRDESYFLYLHFMDTHFPHFLEGEAVTYYGDSEPPAGFSGRGVPQDKTAPLSAKGRRYLDALYDGSLRFADGQMGRLLRCLEEEDMSRTTLLITADHGEMLVEQSQRFGHTGWTMTEALLEVPWILYAPGRIEPTVVDSITGAVDLMPTLLDVAGVSLPPGTVTDGTSQRPVFEGRQEGDSAEWSRFGVFSADQRLSMQRAETWLDGETIPRDPDALEAVAWYDLAQDPDEVVDLSASQPDAAFERLEAYRATMEERWSRYETARADGPPSFAFAVSAKHFRVAPKVEAQLTVSRLDELDGSAMPEGWLKTLHVASHGLFGRVGASPRTIEFDIPSGTYLPYVGVRGAVELRLPGGEWFRVEGAPMDPAPPHSVDPATDEHRLGEIEVRDETFTIEVRPAEGWDGAIADDAAWVLVKHFGFVPEGVVAESADPAELARLRRLGYLPPLEESPDDEH